MKNIDTFYQDDETIVTAEAIVHQGERIPVRSIKRVSVETASQSPLDFVGITNSGFSEVRIELGMFRTKRITGLKAHSVHGAASLSPWFKDRPAFKIIAEKTLGLNNKQALTKLSKVSGVTKKDIEEIEYALADYKRLIDIKDAILKAMAYHGA